MFISCACVFYVDYFRLIITIIQMSICLEYLSRSHKLANELSALNCHKFIQNNLRKAKISIHFCVDLSVYVYTNKIFINLCMKNMNLNLNTHTYLCVLFWWMNENTIIIAIYVSYCTVYIMVTSLRNVRLIWMMCVKKLDKEHIYILSMVR